MANKRKEEEADEMALASLMEEMEDDDLWAQNSGEYSEMKADINNTRSPSGPTASGPKIKRSASVDNVVRKSPRMRLQSEERFSLDK